MEIIGGAMKRLMAMLGVLIAVLSYVAPTASPVQYEGYARPIDQRAVPLIRCSRFVGSGVAIGPHTIITAAHLVEDDTPCVIVLDNEDRYPIAVNVVAIDPSNDFAILHTRQEMPVVYPIDCGGFVPGKAYHGAGYPGGDSYLAADFIALPNNYTVTVEGNIQHFHGLQGVSIEGMSGGPVVNDDQEVVGILNAKFRHGGIVLSKELRDTQICARARTDK